MPAEALYSLLSPALSRQEFGHLEEHRRSQMTESDESVVIERFCNHDFLRAELQRFSDFAGR